MAKSKYQDAIDTTDLVDPTLLEQQVIRLNSGKNTGELNAYECTDKQFVEWWIEEVGGMDNLSRLRIRLRLLDIVEEVSGYRERHWVQR